MERKSRRGLALASVVAAAIIAPAPTASAACHAFTVSASPTTVAEGGTVTVTVERDQAVGGSAVDVRTVDGSARSGADFTGGRQTITFTTETARSFTIPTTNDTTPESAETFKVELVSGSGSGCSVNPDFTYGPPVTVTISASDTVTAAPKPSPTPSPRVSRRASARPTQSVKPGTTTGGTAPTATPTVTAEPSPTPSVAASGTPFAEPTFGEGDGPLTDVDSSDDGGLSTAAIVVLAGVLALALAGGAVYLRRRRLSS